MRKVCAGILSMEEWLLFPSYCCATAQKACFFVVHTISNARPDGGDFDVKPNKTAMYGGIWRIFLKKPTIQILYQFSDAVPTKTCANTEKVVNIPQAK